MTGMRRPINHVIPCSTRIVPVFRGYPLITRLTHSASCVTQRQHSSLTLCVHIVDLGRWLCAPLMCVTIFVRLHLETLRARAQTWPVCPINESVLDNVIALTGSLSRSASAHGACWNAKPDHLWPDQNILGVGPNFGKSEPWVTQPVISPGYENTQLHCWMEEGKWMDVGWKQGAWTDSKFYSFFPPSLSRRLHNGTQWKQSRGGNKQATSSLSVFAAKQPFPRPPLPISVCVCAHGEDRFVCLVCAFVTAWMYVVM